VIFARHVGHAGCFLFWEKKFSRKGGKKQHAKTQSEKTQGIYFFPLRLCVLFLSAFP